MALTLTRLGASLLSTSAAAVYAASGVNTQIDGCTLTNTSGSSVTVSMWLGGDAAVDSNKVLDTWSLAANERYGPVRQVVGHVVPDGGSLFASASVAGVVACVVSGREQAVEE
jgi:hypothetical protein